ncbi:aldo-keto reductase family 1 member C15-like [Glandiceps talaboti]
MINRTMMSAKLATGAQMPLIGFGTYNCKEVGQAVKTALNVGYRHIDCAFVYGNECEIGDALQTKFKDGPLKREDVFVTSKVWFTHLRPHLVRESCLSSLKNLRLDYLDLCLVHWPLSLKPGKGLLPKDEDGQLMFDDVDFVDSWKALENLVDEGKCKSIGVSNFNEKQMERILSVAKHPIAVNQVESHPYLTQESLLRFCTSHGIVMSAYCAMGRPGEKEGVAVVDDPVIQKISDTHNKSPSQVCLRYQIQRGVAALAKSVTPRRIQENFEIFEFELSKEEMDAVNKLNKNQRIILFENFKGHPEYPF